MLSTTNGPMQSLDPSYLLGMAGGELTLRILGNGPQAETVRITATKCTIGSAPTCTVRLESREIKPVHCILLRGRDRTIARKWSESTLLNGHQFTDAVVVEGDVIKVEHIQIEIVRDERAKANADWHSQAFHATDGPPPPDSEKRPRKDAVSAAEIQRLRRLLQHALGIRADQGAACLPYQGGGNLAAQTPGPQSLEACGGRFTHQLTAQAFHHEEMSRDWARERDLLKSELGRLREQLQRHGQHAAAPDRPTQAPDHQADLAAMEGQSAKLEAWQRQLDARARELAGSEEQLAQQRDSWNAAQQQAERQHADAGTKFKRQAAELDQRDQLLKQREAELNTRQAEIAQQREQLAREREARASGQADQLDQCHRELETARNQLACEQSEWANRKRELQQQLHALTAERQKLCDERDAWTAAKQQLCDERDTWHAERQQLCDERDTWHAERQQLCDERDTWTAERQQLCDERDTWTAERQQFCDQRDAWERERQLLEQRQASEDDLATERSAWAAREQELESRLVELEAARVQLEAEREFWMQQQTAETAEAVEAAENEARELAALEAREAACAEQAAELEEQRRQLQDEREQLARDRLELQEEQERLQRETEAMQQQLAEVTAQQDELTTEREVVESQRAELQAARAELEQQSQDLEQQSQDLEQQSQDLEQQSQELAQQREGLVAAHDAQLAAQQQELATMREEVEQQREQLAAVRGELDHAQEALERQREALVVAEEAHPGTPPLAAGVASDQPHPGGGEETLVLESALPLIVRDEARDGGCENAAVEVPEALPESDCGDAPERSPLAEADDEAEWQATEPGPGSAADHLPPPEYQSEAETWPPEDEPSDVPAWSPADDMPAATDGTDKSDTPEAESWWDADAAPEEQRPDVADFVGEESAEMPLDGGTESFHEPPGLQFDASSPADSESGWMSASLTEDDPGVSEDETEMASWQAELRDALSEQPTSDEPAAPMSPEDLIFEPPAESAPVDTASILAQFGQGFDRDSETELSRDGDAAVTADTAEVADGLAAYGAKPVDAGDTDEDSIHEYMKNLLARVGGSAEMLSQLNAAGDDSDHQETSEVESPVAPGPKEAAPTVELMKELPPKPERPAVGTTNLQALREIANQTARSAIAQHNKRQDEVRVMSNLGITLVALLLSGIFYFWSAKVVSLWSALSLICFGGGVFVGVKTTMTIFRTFLDKRSAPDAVPTETDEDPAQADDDAAGTLTESREDEQFQSEPTV